MRPTPGVRVRGFTGFMSMASGTFHRFTAGFAGLAGLSALSLAAPLSAANAAGAEANAPATRPAAAEAQVVEGGKVLVFRSDGDAGEVRRVVVSTAEDGKPVAIRIAEDKEQAGASAKSEADDPSGGNSGGDVVQRLRERRRVEEGSADGPRDQAEDAGGAATRERAVRDRLGQLYGAQRGAEVQRQDQAKNTRADMDKAEKVAFLGINPSPVPPVLSKQLKLPADVGLVVDEVLPGSPADKAGIRQYDVLEKLDDQVLIDPHQLVVLVRGHKAGDTVRLSGVREGQSFSTEVKLAEHAVPHEIEIHTDKPLEVPYRFTPPAVPGAPVPIPPRALRPIPPAVIPLPLAPGEPIPPSPRDAAPKAPPAAPKAKPDGEKSDEPKRPAERRSDAGPGDGRGSEAGRARDGQDPEVRALEQQLQELRAAAERLRAEVRAHEQEARQQRDEAQRQRQQAEAERRRAQEK